MNELVVAAAQSTSARGDLEGNIVEHLRLIHMAASRGANLIVFPELSLTGYELDLARELQLDKDDAQIATLRQAARENDIHVIVGGPWVSGRSRPFLGAFLLSPDDATCYAKIHVHESEAPFFRPGRRPCFVAVRGVQVSLAICADSSHARHAAAAAALGAELYVASVMKTESEYGVHARRLQKYAAQHRMAVMTANYAHSSGGRVSAGGSAFWDESGSLVAAAETNDEALLIARRKDGRWHGEVVDSLHA